MDPVRDVRMLSHSIDAGALDACYVLILVLQLNPRCRSTFIPAYEP